jgi:hypothetical protein
MRLRRTTGFTVEWAYAAFAFGLAALIVALPTTAARVWDKWLRTRGAGRYRPEEFARLLDPEEPLSGYYRSLIDPLAESKVRILDVGAGPLTMLGKTHPTKKLETRLPTGRTLSCRCLLEFGRRNIEWGRLSGETNRPTIVWASASIPRMAVAILRRQIISGLEKSRRNARVATIAIAASTSCSPKRKPFAVSITVSIRGGPTCHSMRARALRS